jgi:hypothetical protein
MLLVLVVGCLWLTQVCPSCALIYSVPILWYDVSIWGHTGAKNWVAAELTLKFCTNLDGKKIVKFHVDCPALGQIPGWMFEPIEGQGTQ